MNSTVVYDNETLLQLCPKYTKMEENMITYTSFWVDGVAKMIMAFVGIFLNGLAFYVLNRPKMKNSFNKCLMALAVFDSIFQTMSIIEALRRRYEISLLTQQYRPGHPNLDFHST